MQVRKDISPCLKLVHIFFMISGFIQFSLFLATKTGIGKVGMCMYVHVVKPASLTSSRPHNEGQTLVNSEQCLWFIPFTRLEQHFYFHFVRKTTGLKSVL